MGLMNPEPVLEAIIRQYHLPPEALAAVQQVLKGCLPVHTADQVVTLYAQGALTYQFTGFRGPFTPQEARGLLLKVANRLPAGEPDPGTLGTRPPLFLERSPV